MADGGWYGAVARMPSWLLKATAQGAISLLPWRRQLNHLLQRYGTRSLVLSESVFESKVEQCRRHLEQYRSCVSGNEPPSSALELGTGWYPVIPVGLALAGVERVSTVDVEPMLSLERTRQVFDLYADHFRRGRLDALLGARRDRVERLREALHDGAATSPSALLARLGIEVMVRDVRESQLPGRSIDLLTSNNTLEHIPPDVLCGVMNELRRLAAPGAVMSHFIDMSDHYAHFDRSISEFNYLRYSDRAWRVFNNRLQYQNRLRISDYRQIIRHAGFRIVAEEGEAGAPRDLDRLALAADFKRYRRADLLVLRSWMTARA